jgi:hypothetical protein
MEPKQFTKTRITKMNNAEINEITINGITYVEKGLAESRSPMQDNFFIVRTYSAGVFAGNMDGWDGSKQGTVMSAIRIWYWKGAASLSQLAMEGTKNPDGCNFAMPVDRVHLTEIIEVLPCTVAAYNSITGVKSWKK